MKLDAWLRQEHPRADRFRLVERLSQALNAVHDRGEVLAALDPSRVDLGTDLKCDLSGARQGPPEPGYAAPERLEGQPPSLEADVYAAGAIAWEALIGRPCGELPVPLVEVAPDLPREIASAVMGCLERSPQWRPKDLTYLAQLAAAQQKALRRGSESPVEPLPSLRAGRPERTPPKRVSHGHLPLLLSTLVVLAAAASSYLWIQAQGRRGTPAPVPATHPKPTPTPDVRASEPAPSAAAGRHAFAPARRRGGAGGHSAAGRIRRVERDGPRPARARADARGGGDTDSDTPAHPGQLAQPDGVRQHVFRAGTQDSDAALHGRPPAL